MMKITHLTFLLSITVLGFSACTDSLPETIDVKNEQLTTQNQKTIIVDVRTVEEWENDGHAECSINYPLSELESKIETLKSYDSITLVCRSGNRANTAKQILENAGIKNIENKGAWQNINCN